MDPFQLLIADHRKVDSLFETLLKDKNFNEEKHRALNSIIRELSIHAVIEEMYLYPSVRRVFPEGDTNAEKALNEHQHVKDILDKLDSFSSKVSSDSSLEYPWGEIKKLQGEVEAHVHDEENRIFVKLRSLLSSQELQELAHKLEEGKKSAPTHPHPWAPNKPPLNKMAGAPAAMVDKIKDKGREFAG